MNKPKRWLERLNNLCLHEKIVLFSLSLVLLILGFDSFFKNLPVSGYALVFITTTLIGGTTWATCHGIKWLLHCKKPLKFHLSQKSQNETLLRILRYINKIEDAIFDKIFKTEVDCFSSFNYPTTVNEQIRLFLKDTERDFVIPWYSEISQNSSFLFDTYLLLEEILMKMVDKLKIVNCKNLVLNVLMLYLNHLQEYKKSLKKLAKTNANIKENNCDESVTKEKEVKTAVDLYRYSHPSSQSDEITNYYLQKVAKWLMHEYAPQEFAVSLQCKILTGVLARKVLRACLTTFEDPVWIYIRLIRLLDASAYNTLLENKVYCVKEKVIEVPDGVRELHAQNSIVVTKRYMKPNIFREPTNLFQRKEFGPDYKLKGIRNVRKVKNAEREALNLSLQCNNVLEEQGHISSVLGGIISSTAGPLLPDDMSVCYEPPNKMWQSPVTEKTRGFPDPEGIPVGKGIIDGVKAESKHPKTKWLPRSKSTDSMSPGDVNEPLRMKDVSIGEELCESVRFTSTEDVQSAEDMKEDKSKQRSGGTVKKLVKTRSFDSGSIAIENAAADSSAAEHATTIERSGGVKEAGDVSPVYEESEDFATTIAKLRSLLQQRESSSTLSDKSAQSLDFPSNASIAETSDSSNRTQSTDLDSSFDSQVAPDMPTDGRLFINICIPKTELITDGCGSPYILYSVQYDGIYKLKEQTNSEEPELVLQTTVVKRKFHEFISLQSRLEECSHLRSAMKGVKGPSKWLNLNFHGKNDELSSGNRKQILEVFLQQLCSKVEICAAPELHEFLAYGNTGNKVFVKKDPESSTRRIDKLLTNKVTDVFNTIKTVLPSFDFDSTASVSISSDPPKGSQDQKLLPGFLSFGNKSEDFELNFDFDYKEPTGESLTDDIRRYFNRKMDGVEYATDVLDSNDWLVENRACRRISSEGKCVWHNYKDLSDEDIDPLDSWLPVYSVILDIFCELLDESDSWVIREPVVRLIKVVTGHWESKIQENLSKLDWDQIMGNVIRLIRTILFHSTSTQVESAELCEEKTRAVLKEVLLSSIPSGLARIVNFEEISSAVSLFVDSLQHFQTNRDVVLRLFDILLVQLLSCRHLESA